MQKSKVAFSSDKFFLKSLTERERESITKQMTKAPFEIVWSKGGGTLVTFCTVQSILKNIAKTSLNSIWVQAGLCWLNL